MNCEKCIAYFEGKCAADKCCGEITMFSLKQPQSAETAKQLYAMAAKAFDEDFNDE